MARRLDVVVMTISSLVAQTVGTRVPSDASLMEAGIDSLAASEVVSSIGAELKVELSATLLFDHPSVTAICQHFDAQAPSAHTMELCALSSSQSPEQAQSPSAPRSIKLPAAA